jgi:peptidylprolyl isomerase
MSQVERGDTVQVHYEGRFENGEVFDTSDGRDPLEFVAGGAQLIPGFSNAVLGMAIGDKKSVTLAPEQAYGERDETRVQRADLELLPEGVQVGDHLQATSGENMIHVLVTEIDTDGATLDANHPLAGKTLVFDIELVSIAAA